MIADLNNKGQAIDTSKDCVVIVDNFQSVRGGRTLDTEGFPNDVIQAGHVIIKETETGNYKPLGLNSQGNAYAALPSGHTYEHILINSILKDKPFAGLLVRGTVNHKAAPFEIPQEAKEAMPLIDFRAD